MIGDPDRLYLVGSSFGYGFVARLGDMHARTKTGKAMLNVGKQARALQAVAQMKQGRILEVTEEIALRAALISVRYRLPMADSLVYATGQMEGAEIWTQDSDFKGLPGVRYREARR